MKTNSVTSSFEVVVNPDSQVAEKVLVFYEHPVFDESETMVAKQSSDWYLDAELPTHRYFK